MSTEHDNVLGVRDGLEASADRIVRAWDATLLAAQCLQRQAQVLPNAGHWVQYEAADPVNALLAGWFAQSATALAS